MGTDSPVRWVRKNVFGVTQERLAEIGGVSRPRVNRYENKGEAPPYEFLRRLRAEALMRGLPFDADWFFEVPESASPCAEIAARVPEDTQ